MNTGDCPGIPWRQMRALHDFSVIDKVLEPCQSAGQVSSQGKRMCLPKGAKFSFRIMAIKSAVFVKHKRHEGSRWLSHL